MKKLVRISLLLLIALFMMPDDADAQRRRKKKKKKKKKKTEQTSDYRLQDHLWYGAGGTLNFQGSNFGNVFAIGITPMVGYKITPWLSAGPRLELTYIMLREDFGNSRIVTGNQVDYGAGVFTRLKSPFGIYGHLEYFVKNDEYISGNPVGNENKYQTDRELVNAAYIGLGYNSKNGFSKWGYEIQLNYDVLAPENTVNLPIDLRVGLTYNF